jgi:large subunit ribosomal protein L17
MRHLKKGRGLSRSVPHRKAVLSNLSQNLFEHKRIQTTLGKARELRPFVEKLITKGKRGTVSDRRNVARCCNRKAAVKALFDEVAPIMAERDGGYTRIIKLGPRRGDAAEMAIIELVGFDSVIHEESSDKDKDSKKKSK